MKIFSLILNRPNDPRQKKKFFKGEEIYLVQSKYILNNCMEKNSLSAYLCLKGFATEISNLFYVGQMIPVKLIHIYIYKK